jgi:hypothetical protein
VERVSRTCPSRRLEVGTPRWLVLRGSRAGDGSPLPTSGRLSERLALRFKGILNDPQCLRTHTVELLQVGAGTPANWDISE